MDKVKKNVILLCMLLVILTGCGSRISSEELQKQEWKIEAKEDAPAMRVHFSNKKVSIKIDPASLKDGLSNDWGEIGELLGKEALKQWHFDYEYTLENNKMTWKNDQEKTEYTVSRKGKNILLTPDDSSSSKNKEVVTLEPWNEK